VTNLRIQARNFRVLKRLDWSPAGVCLLSGANGAGKTSVLDMLLFLRVLFERGPEAAFSVVGARYFRSVDVPEDEPVEFELQVDNIVWKLRFPMAAGGIKDTFGEELLLDGKQILRAAMFEQSWTLQDERLPLDEVRCCAKVLWDRGNADWMATFVDALTGISVFKSYFINQVQRSEMVSPRQPYLHGTGKNLWSVLAGWKAAQIRAEGRFDWVIGEARKAFPGLIATVEFDSGFPLLFPPGAADPESALPPERAAEGLLTGLLHLTAVAGARPGALVAFDEMENQLHPYAIRLLLSAMRQRAEEAGLTIIVTTHSPVVMNEFRDDLEHVFVLDQAAASSEFPVRVTDLHSEEWLAQAKLGTLYDRLAFGAPPGMSSEP
jgi:AAA domain, putative AbiEii toxin, Type IV TA system